MGRVAQASLASVDLLSLLLHLEPLRSEAGPVRKDSSMAVTQQLARLTTDELARCRRSVDALHQLCSFELREPGEYLDLDWSPRALQRAAVLAGLPDELVTAIERACEVVRDFVEL